MSMKKPIPPNFIFDEKRKSFLWKEIDETSFQTMKKNGDRVVFVSTRYSPQENNPVVGSEYQCIGTITKASSVGCEVHWDNGCHNSYSQDDLMLIQTKDPNHLFRRYKNKQRENLKW